MKRVSSRRWDFFDALLMVVKKGVMVMKRKNARIIEVLDKWRDERTKEQAKEQTTNQTEDLALELIAVLQERMREDGCLLLSADKRVLTDADGIKWVPAFTDADEVEIGPASEMREILIDKALDEAIGIDEVRGIVINPWSDSIQMHKPILWWILEARKPREDDYIRENRLIEKAIVLATIAHEGQLRKGTKEPYITHPLRVMSILNEMGADANLLIAGILHGALENTEMTENTILWNFGTDVLELVKAFAENKRKTREGRRQNATDAPPDLPDRVKMLIAAEEEAARLPESR